MSEPQQDDAHRPADPTLRVARPPVPGRAVRAEVAAGDRATPPIRHDEPTVTLTPQVGHDPRRTLEFGTPAPVKVTVSAAQAQAPLPHLAVDRRGRPRAASSWGRCCSS